MQVFTGLNYLFIALANHYGYDKWNWEDRLDVGKKLFANRNNLTPDTPNEPMMFHKTMNAIEDAMLGNPSGYLMCLDATASGLQILACLIGCHDTARNVNLIDTGKREDVYTKVADVMQEHGAEVDRTLVKKPLMT